MKAISRFYNDQGELAHEEELDVPDNPADPVQVLQAQVDALTDIVLGNGL